MATPYSQSNSNGALSTEPSRTLLQQLLEEVNGASSIRTARNASPLPSPTSTYSSSSSQNHSPSVWVGGSILAQNARDKLRAADEARPRRVVANAIDAAPDLNTPRLCLDTSRLDLHNTTMREEHGGGAHIVFRRMLDPVGYPHQYMQHMLKGSPTSVNAGLSPGKQSHGNDLLHLQAPPPGNAIPPPLSPLIFSDVYFDDSSSLSPQTETTISPTDAPTSAATVYTAEELQTSSGDDALKRTHLIHDSQTHASAQKRRTMTMPDLQSEGYFEMAVDAPHCFIGVGGDNRCLLRNETFTERAPTPRMWPEIRTNDRLPELSSFRPTDADPQGQPNIGPSSHKVARAFTSPAEPASPAVPDDPAWMRPMHLVDTGGTSIYTNVHDDGPIRHALCLWCFRTQGSFRKVHKR
ncbi:hypothetical protein E8E12_009469 [Didymella heteroderae]|uniref:Uncharacterized protein n=1 Tax=Didymella heteroderae TaxID=1769908 RepID=A0A9P4WUX7_9PLEO|nr:hypothetical protein E8E12_009469 [Didymella heteroderae]